MSEQVRILRVIEYIGPRDVVDMTINLRHIKGKSRFGDLTIQEAILGETAEILLEEDTPHERN